MRTPKLDLNFLPPAILHERQRRHDLLLYFPAVILTGVLLGALFYFPIYQAGQYQAKIDQYLREYEQLAQARSYYVKSQKLKSDYDHRRQAVQDIQKQRVDIVEIIDGISGVLPSGVAVTSLEVDSAQGVTLVFETDSALRTAQFIVGLRSLPFFEEVEPKEAPLRGTLEQVILKMPFKGTR